jgi:positive regulator of sigma E activity
MRTKPTVSHPGIVREVSPGKLTVCISSESACAGCHAKGACTAADKEDKIVDVCTKERFEIGDQVKVILRENLGMMAVLLGYVVPLLLVVVVLVVLITLQYSEAKAGVASLLVLVPYYGVLTLFRGRLGKSFSFSVEKLD